MRVLASIIIFIVALSIAPAKADSGGGIECAACTVVLTLTDQLALVHNKTIVELLDDICTLFPAEFVSICQYFVDTYGATIIKLFEEEYTPDDICHVLAFCTDPKCYLANPPTQELPYSYKHVQEQKHREEQRKRGVNPWDWILALLKPLLQYSEPLIDIDHDLFSTDSTLRGSSWRGKDCNDYDSTVYPGRAVSQRPATVDHNCNGIYEKNGIDYEQLYCADSGKLGVAIVGDSAGAHFHIPPEWMNASAIDNTTFSNLFFVLTNEIDWPQLSSTTGHVNSTKDVPVSSIYLKMKDRNRCNHRDYQNICKNGLRSGPSIDMAKTLARNLKTDTPVLLTYELIGNDVCSPHHDFDHFTNPLTFRDNLLEILGNFSQVLPNGSHIIFMGLAQGGVLYETMHNLTHPIGVTYDQVYSFLNCLEISPCWAWMNSNATVRQMGDDWAQKLSDIYNEVIATHNYPNFDMAYYPFPLQQIYDMWKKQGGQLWQLIEPIDGFHPNQISNYLLAEWIWGDLLQNHPTFVGKENPHNGDIWNIFGNQGGY